MHAELLSIVIAFLLLSLNATATGAQHDTLFETDFARITDGKLPDGWTIVSGDWKVREGALQCPPGTGDALPTILFGEPAWTDVSIEVTMRFAPTRDTSRWFAVLTREGASDGPGVQFTVRTDPARRNGLELARLRQDGTWHVLQTAQGPAGDPARVHKLRLDLQGQMIRAAIDGETVLTSPRGHELPKAGRAGLRVGGVATKIERVVVRKLPPLPAGALDAVRSTPMVIAHRGWSHLAPENTLVAYRKAMETCADMAECDTYLTSDGVPILLHDRTLQRTTGINRKPRELSLTEIRKLDAGKWKSQEYTGERIPTLRELLELLKGRIRPVIEIKEHDIEEPVLQAICDSGTPPEDVMLFSFYRDVVERMAKLEPLLPTTWLIGDLPYTSDGRKAAIRDALAARVSAIGLPFDRVDPVFVRHAQQCGLSVFVWTVDEPADMQFLVRIGVDAIITNRPDVLCEQLKRERPAK